MYDKTFPIRGMARGDPDRICTWAVSRGAQRPADLLDYLRELYRLCGLSGLSGDVLAAQSHAETGGWTSLAWSHLNPAGIGITNDAEREKYTIPDGTTAARLHCVHMALYVYGESIPEPLRAYIPLDYRWDAAIAKGYAGIASTLADLSGRWAVAPDYADLIAARLNLMDSAGLFRIVEEATMTYTAHQWPGLPSLVYLPTTLKASVKLIPAGTPGWWIGPATTGHKTFTQHFTGNMNSSAASEWKWAAGGGRASIGSSGSYQLIVDGYEVIVALGFDRAAGHAANNTGNMTSYASEMAIAGGYEAAFQNAAHVAAAVIVGKGWEVDTALLQHWNWLRTNGERKNCPSIIRDRGDWSRFVATVTKNAAAIRAHVRGESPTPSPAPVPVYAPPAVIPELDNVSKADGIAPFFVTASGTTWTWVGDRVRATKATGRYQRASKDAARVGPDLKAGEEFDVDWVAFYEGDWWGYTPFGTRIFMADVERISDAKGEEAA